ncbi:hypothetical protein CTAYLR_006773 [Chrysophaeum taylorii]|uniref:Aldehyde dehydrogenase domain-containing protein n=1 Tax=Chrysophaeum taylorii TaxID=2483200 RepID=A0AAD7U8S3_9STRA|nr:hypothetical protein CTAYLR_006773 [Chrysophaeum taylorii]
MKGSRLSRWLLLRRPRRRCLQHYGLWVDGREVEAASWGSVVNPATGEVVYTTGLASVEDVDAAVASAKAAQVEWEAAGARTRGRVLRAAAQKLRDKLPELIEVETRATGRPIREYRAQLGRVPEWLEYHASVAESSEGTVPPFADAVDHVALVRRRALGVCGLVSAFNHPLLLATKKVSVALATGNTCVVKPPEVAPASVVELAKCLSAAGAPPGVCNVATGLGAIAATRLADHDDVAKIDFTGGTRVGRELGAIVGAKAKHYCAELGGNAPVLVFDDVRSVREAVDGVAFAAFVASGQTCVSAKRILVHADVFDDFAARLAAKAGGLRLGDPMDPTTHVGPLVTRAARDAVAAQVGQAYAEGAVPIAGGAIPDKTRCALTDVGSFFEPTVLTSVRPSFRCFQEEIFGPVVSLVPFRDEAEAVALANDNQYALGAAIWTSDVKRTHRLMSKLHAGIIWCGTHHRNSPDAPWGGFGHSGIGRENGLDAHREYTAPYTMIIRTADEPEDWFAGGSARYG